MAYTIPEKEPRSFVAGDTVCWTKSLSDYPADEFTLTYAFVLDGEQFTITCVADADVPTDHYAEIGKATTAGFTAGVYQWQSYVDNADESERYLVASGTCTVATNYASQTTGYDDRTDARVMLDALNAMLRGKASVDQSAMSISGRSLQRMEIGDLLKWRDKMRIEVQREVAAEKAALGLATGLKVRTRF